MYYLKKIFYKRKRAKKKYKTKKYKVKGGERTTNTFSKTAFHDPGTAISPTVFGPTERSPMSTHLLPSNNTGTRTSARTRTVINSSRNY